MLLIGGFTISSALSKTNIDRILITRVLYLAGSRPSTVLLAFMIVSCFASMWIRYHFLPVYYTHPLLMKSPVMLLLLRYALHLFVCVLCMNYRPTTDVQGQPILRTLPPKSAFGPALIVGYLYIRFVY
jgi:phosphate transporter